MNSSTPKTMLLIAEQLAEHDNCAKKKHILVVSKDKTILLRHKDQLTSKDTIIAELNQKHICLGLSAKQWNKFSQAIISAIDTESNVDTKNLSPFTK